MTDEHSADTGMAEITARLMRHHAGAVVFPMAGMMYVFLVEGEDGAPDPEWLGAIPSFLNAHDSRPMAEQIHENYAHGGGWRPQGGFTLDVNEEGRVVLSGSDPRPYRAICFTQLRNETLVLFESAWTAIIQPDGSMEVSRLD